MRGRSTLGEEATYTLPHLLALSAPPIGRLSMCLLEGVASGVQCRRVRVLGRKPRNGAVLSDPAVGAVARGPLTVHAEPSGAHAHARTVRPPGAWCIARPRRARPREAVAATCACTQAGTGLSMPQVLEGGAVSRVQRRRARPHSI